MNAIEPVRTNEREQAAFDAAYESAKVAVYTALKDMFGVAGENLDYFLSLAKPDVADATQLIRDLRKAYRERLSADANRIIGD